MNNEDLPDNSQWHIAYTLPRMEKKLEGYLVKYGFRSLVPKVRIKSRWKDRWKDIDKPLFSSYIFIYMDYWRDRKKIQALPGIHHIVFYKGEPAVIPEQDIEMVQVFVEKFPERLQAQKNDLLQPGRVVMVKYGAFAGKNAEIIRTSKKEEYVVVRFPMIGQALKVEIRTEDLGLEEEAMESR